MIFKATGSAPSAAWALSINGIMLFKVPRTSFTSSEAVCTVFFWKTVTLAAGTALTSSGNIVATAAWAFVLAEKSKFVSLSLLANPKPAPPPTTMAIIP